MLNLYQKCSIIRVNLIQRLSQNHRPWLAIIVLMLGITLLGIMGGIIKHLGESYSSTFLAVARNIFGFVPVLMILIITKKTKSIFSLTGKKNTFLLILRGGSIACAQFCFYLALMKLEFATASTLVFAGPLFFNRIICSNPWSNSRSLALGCGSNWIFRHCANYGCWY